MLNCLVQGANNSVEFIGGHCAVRNCTPEIDRVFVADRKVGANQPIVPAQKLICELCSIVFWRRHDIGLVSQGSLSKGEPDRHNLFRFSCEPHIPARFSERCLITGASIDRKNMFACFCELVEPVVDQRDEVSNPMAIAIRSSALQQPCRAKLVIHLVQARCGDRP